MSTAAPEVPGYRVGELLGEGSHARVFAAVDGDGRSVALKVLRATYQPDAPTAMRMEREAAVLSRLDHPGVVRLLDRGRTEGGHPFLVMERIAGGSLRQRLEEGALTPKEAWKLVREVADAVAAAHARGVLHRDLTSGNVLLEERGRARLTDFGLAWVEDDQNISRDGASIGTPAYMAPEQWWGAGLDERTDVYGLGGLLYEALTGSPPWAGEDPAKLIHQVATAEPPPAREHKPELPESIDRFVARCLARRPEDRPPDVATFMREGDAVFGHRARAFPALPLLAVVALGVTPFVFRYAGTLDPRTWVLESGWGGYSVLLSLPIGAALAYRFRSARLFAPLLPLLNGALGFETGMMVVRSAMQEVPPERRFAIFQLGAAEASACWFLGASLSAMLFAWVAVLELEAKRPTRREMVAAAVPLLAGALTLDPKAIAIALVVTMLILAGASRHPQRAVAALAAVASIALAAWLSVTSDAARVWGQDLLRADRARVLTDLRFTEVALLGASALSAATLIGVSSWRGVRAWPARRVALGAAAVLLSAGAFFGPWLGMTQERNALGRALIRHFAVWSELDPPPGEGDGAARLGLTVQVGRQRVSVESEPVAPLLALRSETGALLLAQELGPRLELGEEPELVVAADRALHYRDLAPVFRVAYELGVRRVDLLLLPGEPLRTSPSAPVEAAMVLPSDLRSLRLELVDGEPASRPSDEDSIEAVARRISLGSSRRLSL